MEDKIDFKKYSVQGKILSIVALFLIAFGVLFMIIDRINTDETIEIKSIELKTVKTELHSIEKLELIDSLYEEKIKQKMIKYFQSVDKKDVSSIMDYYNDTLQEYFLKSNISKEDAKQNLRWYFNKYPNSKVIYDTNSINVSNKNDTTTLIVNGVFARENEVSKEFISKIKINNKGKIVSLKDYLIK